MASTCQCTRTAGPARAVRTHEHRPNTHRKTSYAGRSSQVCAKTCCTLRRIVRLAREQLAPDANVQHPNMLTGPTASRGLRKPAPPSDRHLEKEQPRRGRGAAAKPGVRFAHTPGH